MRSNTKLLGLSLLLAAVPVWAAHTNSVSWTVSKDTTLGTTQIKPGDYELKAEDGQAQLDVFSHGKMIAQVPCRWIQLPSKAAASQVEVDNDKVTQIEFGGKTGALDFN